MSQIPSQLAKLRSVFGPLSHTPPEPSRREVEAGKRAEAEASAYVAERLPAAPVYHDKTGVLLIPSKRIDGSDKDPPWNMPEPVLWDWLRTCRVEHIEERFLFGVNGSMWGRYRNYDGQLKSALLRFGGGQRQQSFSNLGTEYSLDDGYDFLKREQGAYEAMKALGCEDMAPPLAAKEINLVPLISDAMRERVGRELKIPPVLVDETLGLACLMQAIPQQAENFAEYWAKLGPDDTNRWERASDRTRHSIYRAMMIDFILGVPNRMLCDFMHNKSSDSLVVYGFELSFPHPGMSAEWYLQMRKRGWGRRFPGPMEEPSPGIPASGVDSLSMLATISGENREEMGMTSRQMVEAFDETTASVLIQSLVEIGVPPPCVAGAVSRVVFLEKDPADILDNSFDYIRSVLVPLRRGYGLDEGRIKFVADTTSQIMTQALGEPFDFAGSVQEPVPEGLEFTV